MKLHYLSDIHLEFSEFPVKYTKKELSPSKRDILLVAGDTILSIGLTPEYDDSRSIALRERFDKFLAAVSDFKAVYMIAGNHEAYSYGDVKKNKEIVSDYIIKKGATNVRFLENERVPLTKKVDLLACTLWTDMNKGNPNTLRAVGVMMNDFQISNYDGRLFTTQDCADLHAESKAWLQSELIDTTKNDVVMTHHLPSFQSIAPIFKGDVMNFGYASDMDDLIYQNPHITHWIHGHTHHNVDYMLSHTHILGNMRGYPPSAGDRRANNWSGFTTKSFGIQT